jgi:hypothetical protein
MGAAATVGSAMIGPLAAAPFEWRNLDGFGAIETARQFINAAKG